MAFIPKLLEALVAIPKIAGLVEKYVGAVVLWYVSRQKSETLGLIADAAAYAARAQTREDRLNAAQKWQNALSRPRTTL